MHLRALALFISAAIALPSSTRAAAAYSWAHSYGDELTQTIAAVSTDPAGNVLLCGSFYGTVTFSTSMSSLGPQTPAMFVAKLDVNGNPLWNRKIGSLGWDIAGDRDGNVIAVGEINPGDQNVFSNGICTVPFSDRAANRRAPSAGSLTCSDTLIPAGLW